MSDKYTKKLLETLAKGEAPMVAKMRRLFQKQTGLSSKKRKELESQAARSGDTRKSEADYTRPLAKNEYQISSFMDGSIKMEFGPEVPEKIKKRAKDWALRKGLKIAEMGLEKNSDGFDRITFCK